MFISPAFASTAAAPAAGGLGSLFSMMPIFLILLVFYFMVIRPQNNRIRAHRTLIDGLKKGDEVITGGGIIGTVVKAQDKSEEITLKIASSVEISVLRTTVASLRHPEVKTKEITKEKKKK